MFLFQTYNLNQFFGSFSVKTGFLAWGVNRTRPIQLAYVLSYFIVQFGYQKRKALLHIR